LPRHWEPGAFKVSTGTRAIILNAVYALLTAAGLFGALLLMSFSWVKIVAVAAILVPGAVWFFAHGRVRRIFKFVAVGALVFALIFASFESYLILNAGSPAAASTAPTAPGDYTSIMNVSLSGLIRGIENSPTYGLLTAEHGKTNPETIKLDSSAFPDWIEVDFYGQGSNTYLAFMAYTVGSHYRAQVSTYSGEPFSLSYVQASSMRAFSQIDAKGLRWYFDRALQIAQNRTGTGPKIDSLSFTLTVEDRIYMSYEGITVQIVGSYLGASTLIADFEPDGTLIYMSQPAAT